MPFRDVLRTYQPGSGPRLSKRPWSLSEPLRNAQNQVMPDRDSCVVNSQSHDGKPWKKQKRRCNQHLRQYRQWIGCCRSTGARLCSCADGTIIYWVLHQCNGQTTEPGVRHSHRSAGPPRRRRSGTRIPVRSASAPPTGCARPQAITPGIISSPLSDHTTPSTRRPNMPIAIATLTCLLLFPATSTPSRNGSVAVRVNGPRNRSSACSGNTAPPSPSSTTPSAK